MRHNAGFFRWKLKFVFFTAVAASTMASWGALPDLIVNRHRLVRGIEIQFREFSADECALLEGCVSSAGRHKLLLFDAGIANVGNGNLAIGDPAARPELFDYSPCHGHYHIRGFTIYKLLNSSGTLVRRARKQGFCLRDNKPYLADAPAPRGYECATQGISKGWQDIYDKSLDCQFLDITGVPAGSYLLQIIVNPNQLLRESNYYNNTATVPVTIGHAK